MRAALEQQGLDVARAQLVERVLHACRLVLAVTTITSTPAASSACTVVREAAREQTTITGTSAPSARACVERQARLGVEHHPARLARDALDARGELGSSTSAVPMPTATASDSARQRCARARLASPEIHCESPVRVATLPSSVIADLKTTSGRPVRACLRNGWLSRRAAAAISPSTHVDAHALVAQDARPAPGCLLGRVVGGHDHAGDAGREDRVGAGRRAALVAAGLERHVQGRPGRVLLQAASASRSACGSPAAAWKPSPITRSVLDDDRADERVRTRVPARPAGQFDGPLKVARVALCGRRLRHPVDLPSRIDSRVNDTSGGFCGRSLD